MKHTRVLIPGGGHVGRRLAEELTGLLSKRRAVSLVDGDEAALDRAPDDPVDGRGN
jgi:Trk K+ transport system NAD-binding subunit